MKKFFLSAMMLAGAYALCAQQVPTYQATDITYQVPVTIKTNFQVSYPAATTVTWQPMNDWWYATYKDENNRLVSVYYNTQPYYLIRNETFKVALPVLNTLVPEDVITNAINKYGNNLYSITALKTSGSTDMMYQVTLVQNGTAETVMMNGTSVAYNSDSKTPAQ
jgi:hypothetical protein